MGRLYPGDVHSLFFEMRPELCPEYILAKAANHSYWIPKSSHGDGLIGAFASGMNLKISCGDSLAANRNPLGGRD